MKTSITKMLVMTLMVAPLALVAVAHAAVAPTWNTTGNYVVVMSYLGSDYNHDMTLAQDGSGNLTGSGGSPTGIHVYTWVITAGTVSGNTVDFHANYTATADAVTPLTTMHVVGTVASNGTMSGTWTDNYQGGSRSGTWHTTTGTAVALGALHAEDFGVVSYDTGLGMLKGYTAGFGLTDATFAGAQSVTVRLYAGATLLQTNVAKAKFMTDITGTQFSSPFDVSGTFNYGTDGYWTNTRESQYGQSVAATRVVATVILANGKTLTAENTTLTGDPSTIFGTTPPPVVNPPSTKDQCKNDGWMNFTNPSFKNQGQCIKYVTHLKNHTHHQHGTKDNEGHQQSSDNNGQGRPSNQNEHGNKGHKNNHS
jgi:hypothetical protein